MNIPTRSLALISALLLMVVAAHSQEPSSKLKLPSILSDHMVIQRDVPLRVWGWAKPGTTVNVALGQVTATAQSDGNGAWSATTGKVSASGSPVELVVSDGVDTITVRDVLVGDVWVCSGQSNMAFPLGECQGASGELAEANRPQMRFFQIAHESSGVPLPDCKGRWVVCAPESAKSFSAVGYYFGRDILQSQKVPVGLIGANLGASKAEVWLSREALAENPDLQKAYLQPVAAIFEQPEAAKAAHDQWLAEGGAQYEKDRKQWYMDRFAALKKNEPFDRPAPAQPKPEPPYFTAQTTFPTVLFNAKINPLVNFPIRGALWYQGESNANDPLYDKLLAALITDWRKRWQIGDFPFLIVQLPNKSKQQKDAAEPVIGWATVRDRQMKAHQAVPNTGLIPTIDLGSTNSPDENRNLHPDEKENIALRLALAAGHFAYGENVDYGGPIIESATVTGNKIQIAFRHAGDGLKIGQPPKSSLTPQPPTDELHGFAIAGKDKKFVAAKAAIEGTDKVLVWSEAIPDPAFVRYGWQMSPVVNLYSSAGLPAFPFRTDTD